MYILVLFFCSFVACHQNERGAPEEKTNMTIALDLQVYFGDRQAAALKLNDKDAKKLRETLLARLPGQYDVNTGNDLSVLAVIGDLESADKLEKMIENPPGGKIGSIFNIVIQNIKDRKLKGAGNIFPQEVPRPN